MPRAPGPATSSSPVPAPAEAPRILRKPGPLAPPSLDGLPRSTTQPMAALSTTPSARAVDPVPSREVTQPFIIHPGDGATQVAPWPPRPVAPSAFTAPTHTVAAPPGAGAVVDTEPMRTMPELQAPPPLAARAVDAPILAAPMPTRSTMPTVPPIASPAARPVGFQASTHNEPTAIVPTSPTVVARPAAAPDAPLASDPTVVAPKPVPGPMASPMPTLASDPTVVAPKPASAPMPPPSVVASDPTVVASRPPSAPVAPVVPVVIAPPVAPVVAPPAAPAPAPAAPRFAPALPTPAQLVTDALPVMPAPVPAPAPRFAPAMPTPAQVVTDVLPTMKQPAPAPASPASPASPAPAPSPLGTSGNAGTDAARPSWAAPAKAAVPAAVKPRRLEYASWWRQGFAAIVDGVGSAAVVFGLVRLVMVALSIKPSTQGLIDALHDNVLQLVPVAVAWPVGVALWHLLALAVGSTVGQRLAGLRLVDSHGHRAGPIRLVIRALVTGATSVFFIGPAWALLLDGRRRGFGDIVARTAAIHR